MAVTSHWIQGVMVQMPDGPKLTLKLCTDLIGFLRVPGRHDGLHLAHAFLHIIEQVKIVDKVSLYPSYCPVSNWSDASARLGHS